MCNKLLLLGKGGKTVFMGQTADSIKYFASKGFQCPPLNNPADFFMEVISGYVLREENVSATNFSMTSSFGNLSKSREIVTDPKLLIQLWEEHVKDKPKSKQYPEYSLAVETKSTNFFLQVVVFHLCCHFLPDILSYLSLLLATNSRVKPLYSRSKSHLYSWNCSRSE